MLTLAIDTAQHSGSVALAQGQAILGMETDVQPAQQAETLFSMIEQVFLKTATHYKDLDAIAITVGPGSFTGIRIGIAAVRGLVLATGLPLIGITALEATAWQAEQEMPGNALPVVAVLDARRQQVYHQSFSADNTPSSPPALLDITGNLPEAFPEEPFVLAGNAIPLVAPLLQEAGKEFMAVKPLLPDAAAIARLANKRHSAPPADCLPVNPLYIRKPDAKISTQSCY